MSFRVYNTLTRQKELFEPREEGKVAMYNCGPTVYNRQHIGNFRAFLFADLLRRWLEYIGYDVRQVMNITDVGHLTDDDHDEGEDKIEVQAKRTGKDPWKISKENTDVFLEDLQTLGIQPAHVHPRATDHIPEMVEIIEKLIEQGHAYRVGGNVYFDVTTFERYGRLSGNKLENLDDGSRIAINKEKRNPADFALWKSDEHHLMKWDTVFGPDGFPGWHIECSAMARKHLSDSIDIHTGGEDNIFPHHECEIAQSECFSGEPFARYWMHTKFLQVDGGKMSKSLGNVYSVDDVQEKGYTPRELRFCLLRGQYRTPLNFTWSTMVDAKAALDKLDDLVQRLRRVVGGEGAAEIETAGVDLVESARAEFEDALNDDLNVPRALPALFNLRPAAIDGLFGSKGAQAALDFLECTNAVLSVLDLEEKDLDGEIEALIAGRQKAREEKNWAEADRLRDEILGRGVLLEDTPQGVTWRWK